jgi:hypothetical protein
MERHISAELHNNTGVETGIEELRRAVKGAKGGGWLWSLLVWFDGSSG